MKRRILLIEDDNTVRESLVRVLSLEDYVVLPAASGEEGLQIASAVQVDLVLLDLSLPGKPGWDVFAEMTGRTPLLPIIVITAKPHQLFTSLAAGVGALMEKPLDFPVLLRTIVDLLSEPKEVRLARMLGVEAPFRYVPSFNTAAPTEGINRFALRRKLSHSDR